MLGERKENVMDDGDDLVIGEKNTTSDSTTRLHQSPGGTASVILDVKGGAYSISGISASGNNRGISAGGGQVGVEGSGSITGVKGTTVSGEGVEGFSDSGTGVLGRSSTGIGVLGSVGKGVAPFEVPSKVGVVGESKTTGGVGVYGHAEGTAVQGRSVSGMGVYADTVSGWFAVCGQAPNGVAVYGDGRSGVYGQGSKFGITGKCSDGYAGYFVGNVFIEGDLTKTGVGSSVAVRFPDRSYRQLYSIESPESWFEDFGEGRLVKGKAEVKIDPDFAKTVNLKKRYYVFVTPHSTKISGLAVVARLPGRFRVEHPDSGNGSFSYRVIAKRADIRVSRLKRIKIPDLIPKVEHASARVAKQKGGSANLLKPPQ